MAIDTYSTSKGDIRYRVRLLMRGKQINRSFRRKFDALQFEKEVSMGVVVDPSKIAFKQACEEWLKNHALLNKQPSSIRADTDKFRKHLYPLFEKRMLQDIEPEDINLLIDTLGRKGLKVVTINKSLQLMRAIFNYFIRRRTLMFNPVTAVGLLKVSQPPYQFWHQEDVSKFLSHAKTKYAGTPNEAVSLFYKVALNTGMRLGELIALQWYDIDLESGLIVARKTYCHVLKAVKPTTKSGKIRHIPISDAIYSDLKRTRVGRKSDDYVFSHNGHRIDPDNLRSRYFERDIVESGVQRIRIHDMRHTFASHFMMNGGALYELQAILGHSTSDMTQRYAHLSKAFLLGKRNIVSFVETGNVISVDFQKKEAKG